MLVRPIEPGTMLEAGAIAPDAAGESEACAAGPTDWAAVDDRTAGVATGPTGAHEAATSARANAASPTWIDRRLGIAPTEDSLGSLLAARPCEALAAARTTRCPHRVGALGTSHARCRPPR